MRTTLLFAGLLAAFGPAAAEPPLINVPGDKIETGDPIPKKPVSNPACLDGAPGATRWVDSNPHTPLAVVDRDGIHGEAQPCCAPWARRGSRWRTVNAYGAVTGEAELISGFGYDVTQCYQLAFKQRRGSPGIGLYVSAEGDWRSPRSARWAPSAAQRADFARLLAHVEAKLPERHNPPHDVRPPLPLARRTLYFTMPGPDGPIRYAVAGGRALVVARLDAQGRFRVAWLDISVMQEGFNRAYQPLGAFDLDGDQRPELILHIDRDDGWYDVILQFDAPTGIWFERAQSVGGSVA
ncbi:MAG: hypothetical protein KC620_14295 [Myxococcales bacterium]|nr:hypothetical protein [Myxococcales bacterium]